MEKNISLKSAIFRQLQKVTIVKNLALHVVMKNSAIFKIFHIIRARHSVV